MLSSHSKKGEESEDRQYQNSKQHQDQKKNKKNVFYIS